MSESCWASSQFLLCGSRSGSVFRTASTGKVTSFVDSFQVAKTQIGSVEEQIQHQCEAESFHGGAWSARPLRRGHVGGS